jgi:Arc/MetJ family transcription regulator
MAEVLSFWQSISLEELAEQQGVSAAEDLDAISALWPADDDPEDLLRHLLGERFERHKRGKSQGRDGR